MKFAHALEVTHELADHAKLDEKLAEVITSDLNEQAATQQKYVDMFEEFISEHRILIDRFGLVIDSLEDMEPEDIPEISLEAIRAIQAGELSMMMSTTLELACQAVSDVETVGDKATWMRMSAAINFVGQFWIEAGPVLSAQFAAKDVTDTEVGPGL